MSYTAHRLDWLGSPDLLNLARCAHERALTNLPRLAAPEGERRRWIAELGTARLWSERLSRDLQWTR